MSMVSGGRVWNLPGAEESMVNGKRRMSSYVTYLIALVFPLSLVNLSAQCYANHLINESRMSANNGGEIGEGYKIVNSLNYFAMGGSFICFLVLATTSVLFYVIKSNILDQKPLKMAAAFTVFAILIFGPLVATNFIVPLQNSSTQNFNGWAKEKYGLSKLESYDGEKTALDALDNSGEKVKMYVYRSPENLVYLYRSEEDLQKILTKNITVNTQNDTE